MQPMQIKHTLLKQDGGWWTLAVYADGQWIGGFEQKGRPSTREVEVAVRQAVEAYQRRGAA